MPFQAHRAVSPTDGVIGWVLVDDSFEVVSEPAAFCAWMTAIDRSPNTVRVYAGRVARFLTWCEEEGATVGARRG